jgi:hypothetical protein
MKRNEQRQRIPTSDELEQRGALAPATGPVPERRGLLKFFRVGRLRVSDDVAARKHVGDAQPRPPVTAREAAAISTPPTGMPVRPNSPIVPRKIRMDPSVKERRGLGRTHHSQESDN